MRLSLNLRPALALLTAFAVMAAHSGLAQARELSGRLHFGKRTQLHLEEQEGMVKNLLRSLKLVGGKAEVTNLNNIAVRNAYVFIGEDLQLYFYDRTDQKVFHIGDATDLGDIKVNEGVVLKAVEDLQANFAEGESELALEVEMQTQQEQAPAGTNRARFKFWLETMVGTYDETLMTELDERNYDTLMFALSTALPDGDNFDPRAFEHLKIVRDYVADGTYTSAKPLRQLVDRMLKTLKANMQQSEAEADSTEILEAYETLSEKLSESDK